MPKRGAMLLTKEEKKWILKNQETNQALAIFQYTNLPKKLPLRFRFLAWTVGMPPNPQRIEKRCRVRPEDAWFEGRVLHYTESDPTFHWIAKSPLESCEEEEEEEEEDDDDDEDEVVPARRWIGWHGYGHLSGYFCDEAGNWYDPAGTLMPAYTEFPDEIQYSLPSTAGATRARSRRFTPMEMPERNDVDNSFVVQDERTGLHIRYSHRPPVKIYGKLGKRRVEDYRSF